MPKPDTDIEYHVTLRTPVCVKLGTEIVPIRSFDATTEWERGLVADSVVFKLDRIWRHGGSGAIMDGRGFRATLTVTADNIAGMIPQPFVER